MTDYFREIFIFIFSTYICHNYIYSLTKKYFYYWRTHFPSKTCLKINQYCSILCIKFFSYWKFSFCVDVNVFIYSFMQWIMCTRSVRLYTHIFQNAVDVRTTKIQTIDDELSAKCIKRKCNCSERCLNRRQLFSLEERS